MLFGLQEFVHKLEMRSNIQCFGLLKLCEEQNISHTVVHETQMGNNHW